MIARRSLSHGLALLTLLLPGIADAQGLPTADLRVISIGAPSELYRGLSSNGDVWIANDGTADANGFMIDVYLGSPAIAIGQLGPFSVAAATRIRPMISIDVPPMAALGASTLFVIVDPTSLITETREGNNTANVAVTIRDPLPNLVARLDPARIDAEVGELTSIPFTVENIGVTDAPATSLAIYVSVDPRITTSDRRVDVVPVPPLPPGQPYSANAIVSIPIDLAPGVYWVGAIADAGLTAAELDENDNVALGGNIELFVPELRITTVELPTGIVGTAYLAQLTAIGGALPPTWTIVAGSLPRGLSLDPATGVIAGVPTEAATITLLVEATSGPASASASLDLQILPSDAPLAIRDTPLPRGVVGDEYAADLWATGGAPPYSFSAAGLPPGLRVASDGLITGTPTRAGRFVLDVRVTDARMNVARAELALEIDATVPELTIDPAAILPAAVGRTYDCEVLSVAELTARGGTPPYAWSIDEGALPPGFTLTEDTGRICGRASEAGEYSFVVRASDARGDFDTERFTLGVRVVEPIAITTTRLPGAILTRPYSARLTVERAVGALTWSVEGTLPPGLELTREGELRGVPTTAGVFAFAVRVRDSIGAEDVAALSIEARRIDGGGELDTAEGTGCTSTEPHASPSLAPLLLLAALAFTRRAR